MKLKLTFEDGLLVLREKGSLRWSCHSSEVKDYEGGFKELIIDGKLIETNTITGNVNIIE